MFRVKKREIESDDQDNVTGNPYATTLTRDGSSEQAESDDAEPQMWQAMERIQFWCIGLTISLLILIVLFSLPLAYALSQPRDQFNEETLALSSIICGLILGVFLLVRYIRAQSQALASRRLTDLAVACEAQFDCWRIGALSVLVEVGVFIGLAFFA